MMIHTEIHNCEVERIYCEVKMFLKIQEIIMFENVRNSSVRSHSEFVSHYSHLHTTEC